MSFPRAAQKTCPFHLQALSQESRQKGRDGWMVLSLSLSRQLRDRNGLGTPLALPLNPFLPQVGKKETAICFLRR